MRTESVETAITRRHGARALDFDCGERSTYHRRARPAAAPSAAQMKIETLYQVAT